MTSDTMTSDTTSDTTGDPVRHDRQQPNRLRPPIAVVGVSALFPGSSDSTGFWRDILAGTDRMTDVPPSHWLIEDHYDPDPSTPDRTYGRRGGFLDPIDFDALGFGIPPSTIPSTDTAQLLALIVAQRVLDDALRGQFGELDRARASVILGVTSGQELFGAMASRMSRPMWLQGMRRAGIAEDVALEACDRILALHPEWTESTFPGLLGNVVAGRIANRLDLGGTNCVTDAACASSFSAISMGVNELYLGDSDLVIAGGVDTMNDVFMYMCFSKTPALSKSGDIRPFSDRADGTMLGEGIGMVALKRLADAERDGNDIYCIVNGVGSSSDGRSKSVYAPVSSGQARALDDAYAKARYGPDTVELVEAHGTGTVAGDAAEFGGLELAFEASGRSDRQWCALGSVKSQIGHTKAAAGAAGLFKVVMALHHRVLPQTAKIDAPNPELDLAASPFHLNTRSRPWVRDSEHERRGSVSSFGFGGSNFHIALSEYTGDATRAPRLRTADSELVIVCGTDGSDVVEQARRHVDSATDPRSLTFAARTSQLAFDPDAPARLAVTASDIDDLRTKLTQAAERIATDAATAFSTPNGVHYGVGRSAGDVAFVFPGQGSQYLHMGTALATSFTTAMDAWDLAADQDWCERALHAVVFPITSFEDGADESDRSLLTATNWAQPAIGTASLAMLRLLQAAGVEAQHVAGHSFGEITALHAAGILTDVDMISVARHRGDLMAAAARTPGSMTAVRATIDEVRSIVEGSGADVVIANHNGRRQVVVSGPTDAVERIEGDLARAGLAAQRLAVATAFHSPVVSGAGGAFAELLADVSFATPQIAVYSNETAQRYPDDPGAIRTQLAHQLARPVRFVEMIEEMYANGARTFVEVGPSSVLTGLVGDILEGREHRAIPLDKKQKAGLGPFFDGIGQLAAAGVPMDLGALWREYGEVADPHDADGPRLAIAITGANHASPYPPLDLNELAEANPVTTTPTPPAVLPTPAGVPPLASAPLAPAPPAPAPPVPAAAATQPDAGVLAAYQAAQQQTAAAHTAYLNTMAQAHGAFLDAAQQGIAVLGRLAGATVASISAPPPPTAPSPAPPSPVPPPAAVPVHAAPVHTASTPMPSAPSISPATPTSIPTPSTPAPSSSAPVTEPAPVASAEPLAVDMTTLLLGVVSDRTGYPVEMLGRDMELESDLGIDSIKRVEILSAMQDLVTDLPDVDLGVMAALATLGQIIDHLDTQLAGSVTSTPPAASSVTHASVEPLAVDMTTLLLGVVSDRTGYPVEMLGRDMELESDLGIDSIKRVEILSAMQDLVTDLPDVDLGVMAALATLGQIIDHLDTRLAGPPPAPSTSPSTDNSTTDPTPTAATASVPPAPPAAGGGVGRFVVRTAPDEPDGTATPGLFERRIVVTDDGDGVAAALVEALVAHGVDAILGTIDDVARGGGVVDLGNLRPTDSVDAALALNRDAFGAARTFATADHDSALFVVVDDQGGTFGRTPVGDGTRSWASGLGALARTAAIEWPDVTVRAIDVERGGRTADAVAAAIADELLNGGAEPEVGLPADGRRLVLTARPTPVRRGPTRVGSKDVLVVSGGGRGVTAATMIELARTSWATFVLLGRSELHDAPDEYPDASDDSALKQAILDEVTANGDTIAPSELTERVDAVLAEREIRATVAAIEAAGGRARYLVVDITDSKAVDRTLAAIRSDTGPITGVVHGAGVIADKLIVDKTIEQFDRVFDTKVVGLRNLLEAMHDDALKLICLFSSVAARTGNIGQADYAMANDVLNRIALREHARRGDGCVVKSIGWGPWAGGMVTPSLERHFEERGVELLDLAAGSRMLVDELSSPQTDEVEVVLGAGVVPPTVPPTIDPAVASPEPVGA